jgi:hypothetical protein
MRTTHPTESQSQPSAITGLRAQQIAVFVCALMFVLPGVALVLAPTWFYAALATFPPFNRHFMGDAGVFSFALGVGLLIAVRQPRQHRSVIGAAAIGSALHLLNHLYDDLIVDGGNMAHLVSNSLPLGVVAMLLVWVYLAKPTTRLK